MVIDREFVLLGLEQLLARLGETKLHIAEPAGPMCAVEDLASSTCSDQS